MSFNETIDLAPDYTIARVICGGWQLAGGHGEVDRSAVLESFAAFYEAGIASFDCADIYTGVEDLIGAFRATLLQRGGQGALHRLKVHTKFVPDIDVLARIDRAYVAGIIERSLARLRMERLDLVQFHWWDYDVPGYMETAGWLKDLQDEGKIDLLGGTNFDTAHLKALIAAGVPLKTLQVQYSLLDRRPEASLVAACRRLGVQLLCYGTVAGGFLSERWLDRVEPNGDLENRSLVKYRLIIDAFGGWPLFQDLLRTLHAVAVRHGVAIATVASRYMLDKPAVAAVIVGARDRRHLAETQRIAALRLTDQDRAEIEAVLARASGPLGDVYALERDRSGPHGSIMRYNANA